MMAVQRRYEERNEKDCYFLNSKLSISGFVGLHGLEPRTEGL